MPTGSNPRCHISTIFLSISAPPFPRKQTNVLNKSLYHIFLRWARQVGPNTAAVVKMFLSAYKVEQQGYKSCMALLKSADKYSSARLEAACKKALAFTPAPSLKSIQSILKSGQDKLPDEDDTPTTTKVSQYSFTRGAGYYRRDK